MKRIGWGATALAIWELNIGWSWFAAEHNVNVLLFVHSLLPIGVAFGFCAAKAISPDFHPFGRKQ